MIEDLQPGEVVIAKKIDRISRLPLVEAKKLVNAIRAKGARLAVPGIVDLSELAEARKAWAARKSRILPKWVSFRRHLRWVNFPSAPTVVGSRRNISRTLSVPKHWV